MNESSLIEKQRKLVLFVDDQSMIRMVADKMLRNAGFDVVTAENGFIALRLFDERDFDMVLIDMIMPEIDGYKVCEKIRAHKKGQDIPILIMTGSEDMHSIQTAFEVGATDFVTKPINWTLLIYRIQYIFKAGSAFRNLSAAMIELKDNEEKLTRATEIANIGYWSYHPTTQIISLSRSVISMFSLPVETEDLPLSMYLRFIHPDDVHLFTERLTADTYHEHETFSFEHRLRSNSGLEYMVHEYAKIAMVDGELVVLGTIQDISEQKSVEAKINYLANFDPVTDLPNQLHFRNYFTQRYQEAKTQGLNMALLFINVSNLKKINDSIGHSMGDMYLNKVASVLRSCAKLEQSQPTGELGTQAGLGSLARFASDDFTLLLPNIHSNTDAQSLAEHILAQFENPIQLRHHEVYPMISIGISVFPHHGVDLPALLKSADVARHHCQTGTKNAFLFFDDSMSTEVADVLTLESELRKAIEHGELEAYYQPKLALKTNTIFGFELLCRWNHPRIGLVSPVDFIPLAEEVGLIIPMGYWLIEQACLELIALRDTYPDINIAINLSAIQLHDPHIIKNIHDIIIRHGVDARNLEFELTESVLMDDKIDAISKLHELAALGVSIAVDDFGTGYSSLSYLKQLPVDTLKIDRSFVKDITQDSNDEAITKAIIAMSHNLNLKVVAEGVETEEQQAFLLKNECDLIQGYLISRPVPASGVEALLIQYNGGDPTVVTSHTTLLENTRSVLR